MDLITARHPWINLSLLAFLSAGAGFLLHKWTATDSPAAVPVQVLGRTLPEFSLSDLDGQVRASSEWHGQLVVMNFWATWCPPCRKEIPEFIELQQKYAGHGVRFIGINMDKKVLTAKQYAQEMRINYPILTGSLNKLVALGEELGNQSGGLPYTVIISREARIIYTHQGLLPGHQAEQELRRYL